MNNSYDFIFDGCYSENHAAAIYLTGGSKGNQFLRHRLSGGTGRVDQIVLDGPGVYSNVFDVKGTGLSGAEVSVSSNSADQHYNKFSGEGINFIPSSIAAVLDYSDVRPSLNYVPAYGVGLIRLPAQGYVPNVNEGSDPGQITGIGTTTATLHAKGMGEITIGNGITGATTITAVDGLLPNSFLLLRSAQAAHTVTLSGNAFGLAGGKNAVFTQGGQQILFWVGGDLGLREVGRNFRMPRRTWCPMYPRTEH